jgi:predicted 3-demethylubiquinone-9 3-methyltransferase (glyoxalase superfamily)
MQRIVPFLWFDGQAEEAMAFYTSVFPNSRVVSVTRYGSDGPGPEGTVMVGQFELEGQTFYALNGGPEFSFTPAVSFFVNCETQEEIDELWARLTDGGEEVECGWLKDRYGVSWQIVPRVLVGMLGDPDPEKSSRVMKAMISMVKLDIGALREAYEG